MYLFLLVSPPNFSQSHVTLLGSYLLLILLFQLLFIFYLVNYLDGQVLTSSGMEFSLTNYMGHK